ncbi:MAG: hypothetical protein ACOCQD_03785 [archaeon]
MKFEMSERACEIYSSWRKEHDKNCPYLYRGSAGGRITFCFTPNSLGMTETIVRCACGAYKAVSEEDDC